MNKFNIKDRMPTVFWHLVIIFIVISSSAAGYYSDQSYLDFMNKGYYSAISQDEITNPLSVLGTIGSVVCAVVMILRPPLKMPTLILIILPVLLWLVISSLWSNTFTESALLALKTIIYVNALDCALTRIDAKTALTAFTWAIAAILLSSLVLCIADPIFRMSIGADGWRGLFTQKNRLSSFCLFSVPILFLAVRSIPLFAGVTLALTSFMLIMSQGKAAITILALGTIVMLCVNFILRGVRQAKPTLAMLCFAFVTIFVVTWIIIIYQINSGVIDFTGRTRIWSWFLSDLGNDIIIGKGGLTAAQDPRFVERAITSGIPTTSDSSYVMILYNNGLMGLLIFFTSVASFLVISIQQNSKYSIYPIIAMFCYVVFAATESDTRFFPYFSTYAVLAVFAIANKVSQERRTG